MSVGMGITSKDARKSFEKLEKIVNKCNDNKDKKEKQKFENISSHLPLNELECIILKD